MQYIQFQGQNASQVPTPVAGGSNLFIDLNDFNIKAKDENGQIHGGGGDITTLTYTGLVSTISTSGLSTGSFYMISDFKTCYDQPDFDIENNPITTGNTKQGVVEPIIVFATSTSTISMDAYQPLYPNDKIQYDWTFSATEVTNSVAYGRITERIDEFNNRTDYDHRTILFKRYRLYTHREGLRLNGTVELGNDGIVNGVNTSFTALTVGNVIYIPNAFPNYYEIVSISGNTIMTVSGDTIGSTGVGSTFYLAVDENNDSGGYFSYKRTNVKTNDFIEFTTFGNAIGENYAKNNYVGNFANNYTNISSNTFILANNVFLEGQYESNKFGDYCFNNTFGTDNQNNTWGDYCYENVSTNDIDTCIIGHYFYGNLINLNLDNNQIGNNFHSNRLFTENSTDFGNNKIGNYFNNNTLYSGFYHNTIGNNFQSNTIGDYGNLDNFEFYRNRIENNFNQNIIRQDFQNNQIGNQFNNNKVNGDFYKNVIGNGFNNNYNVGYDFYGNHIGNGFNNNDVIGDYFKDNQIGEYFNDNSISYNFKSNKIGNQFENNTLGNTDYFNWDNTSIENLTGRTYDTFYNSLYGDGGYNIGNIILGKELIMHDTVNDEYHKVKFSQWTQNGNGGGFSYERTKVYPTVEPTVYFTKRNYGSEVDIISAGILEIKRANGGAIYNQVEEGNFNQNVSPYGTEWNSIYTENNIGSGFEDNIINNEFKGNFIINSFQNNDVSSYISANHFSGGTYNNKMGIYTFSNDFLGYCTNNTWSEWFEGNTIGDGFRNNTFTDNTYSNTIGINFASNEIKSYFNNNTILDNFGYGYNEPQGNKIGNNFNSNQIGEYFYNNSITDNFYDNQIGNFFQWNVLNTNINNLDFTSGYGNITGFTYVANGTTAGNPSTTDVVGTTNADGIDAKFTIISDSGSIVDVNMTNYGRLFLVNDTITVLGTQIGGATPDDDVVITITGVSETPAFYEHYTKQIFERKNGGKRVSYYDENDILTIDSVFDASGYNLDVYSQDLSGNFSINYVSFQFYCDGGFVNDGGVTNKTVTNMSELVEEFNSNTITNKYGIFFDNGDGRLGLTMNKFFKDAICPTGTITLNVYND